jgi:hypothetical protein
MDEARVCVACHAANKECQERMLCAAACFLQTEELSHNLRFGFHIIPIMGAFSYGRPIVRGLYILNTYYLSVIYRPD